MLNFYHFDENVKFTEHDKKCKNELYHDNIKIMIYVWYGDNNIYWAVPL